MCAKTRRKSMKRFRKDPKTRKRRQAPFSRSRKNPSLIPTLKKSLKSSKRIKKMMSFRISKMKIKPAKSRKHQALQVMMMTRITAAQTPVQALIQTAVAAVMLNSKSIKRIKSIL